MCVCVFSKFYNSFFLPKHIERKTRKNHLFCAIHCGSDPNPEVGCVLFECVDLHWSIGFSCPIIPSYIKTLTIPSTALHTFYISLLTTGLLSKLLPILKCLKFFIFMIRFDIIMHRTVLLIQVTKVRDLCLQNFVTKNISALTGQE